MKKTKIVCTMGPTTDNPELLQQMIASGMDVARFNFSHGTHAEQGRRLELVRAAAALVGKPVALMADTKGPEVRLGIFAEGKVTLRVGEKFVLTTATIEGTQAMASVNYAKLPQDVKTGDKILLDDGKLIIEVEQVSGQEIFTKVIHGGVISSRKRVAVPGVPLGLPFLSEQDEQDLQFAVAHEMDYVAASFVCCAADVMVIRKVLEENGSSMGIIAKIESRAGVDNLEAILEVADGVMVARGDLGVEIPAEEVPIVQKRIIAKCNAVGKPVITATQMLESMINSYRATRAEASDVANSIFDGTDAIMLSGETASGQYPLEAVQTMAKIAVTTERALDYVAIFRNKGLSAKVNTANAISHATVQIAHELDADAILSITESGYTAKLIAKYRPEATVLAVTPQEASLRRMQLYWGVQPILGPHSDNTDEIMELSLGAAQEAGLLKKGDLVVITAGVPVGQLGSTNLIKVINLGTTLLKGVSIGRTSVVGRVCLVRSAADLERLTPTSIMVVAGMENEMGAAASKAAGIIAEEGGFTSAAAIVGITCRIPTIVGADGAMNKLKDGQEITMDMGCGAVYEGKINIH